MPDVSVLSTDLRTRNRRSHRSPPPLSKSILNVKRVGSMSPILRRAPRSPISAATATSPASLSPTPLLEKFLDSYKELDTYKNGTPVTIDGQSLSIAAVIAAARHSASVTLDSAPAARERVQASRDVLQSKLDKNLSIYGVSTGFGGSADTRTSDHFALGSALLQHQHGGVLSIPTSAMATSTSTTVSPTSPSTIRHQPALPLLDPLTSTSMPEAWVRGAILIRINSLIRGHSGVRWDLLEKLVELLEKNVVPVVPLRGSISASGDLSPLSYIAGTLVGNPGIRVWYTPAALPSPMEQDGVSEGSGYYPATASSHRLITSSINALNAAHITPLPLLPKEQLGILNGTAFSCSVAALALHETVHLTLLSQLATAMGVEALLGSSCSFSPFIHDVSRPHPGQVEVARVIRGFIAGSKLVSGEEEEPLEGEDTEMTAAERTINEDRGILRQDRYPLRTSPQWIGPQVEDLLKNLEVITRELNSTTDNPLVDASTGIVHHGGNFQAMSITNTMEQTRLSIQHLGKILFAQSTEILNPTSNRGLPPNLASTDPSLNFFAKGLDIATAAYVSELGFLSNPVSSHVQSAEMHNQAVNSLALISARQTIQALDVLSILMSTYFYILCQALDLRAMIADIKAGLQAVVLEELARVFPEQKEELENSDMVPNVLKAIMEEFDKTSCMDRVQRMEVVSAAVTTPIVDYFTSKGIYQPLVALPDLRSSLSTRFAAIYLHVQSLYLTGEKGATPASQYLSPKTRVVYEFVRTGLGVKTHGMENLNRFADGWELGVQEDTIGGSITKIYEAIKGGEMMKLVAGLFD